MIDSSLYHDAIKDKMQKYGLPDQKKYPMPDKKQVISAIKFFNYVDPIHEKELAKNILKRIKEYGMSFDDFGVGEDNRFSKYLPKEDHLEHHGILGQKWGIRRFQNKDGTRTEEGKKRYNANTSINQNAVHKIVEKSSFDEDISDKVFSVLHADKKYIDEARDVYKEFNKTQKEITKEVDETFKELRNEQNLHAYEAASELADWGSYFNKSVNDCTLLDLGQSGFMGVLEDGQQGKINAYSMWSSEKGIEDKVDKLHDEASNSYKESFDRAKQIISDGLKEVNGDKLTASPRNDKWLISDDIAMHMRNIYDRFEDTSGHWYLNEAAYAKNFSSDDKTRMADAKKYVSKIDKANESNTWWYVTEAAENLGLTGSKLGELSDSDWNRINKEIKDLRNSN